MSQAKSVGCALVSFIWLSSLVWTSAAIANPVNLSDATPRWVEVRFEVSPGDAPGRLDDVWGPPRRAFFEPDANGDRVRIRIPGDEFEDQLRSTGADPIAGTFSEFVWTLDAITGHVMRAEFTGRLRETFGLGFLRSSAEIEIHVEMTTRAPAGYRAPNRILGLSTHGFCVGSENPNACTLVPPLRFDRQRGYVNAVGSLRAVSPLARIQTFSPLGEVVFTEMEPESTESMVSGRSSHDAVCSLPINGSCRPDLRGESS